MRSCQYNLSLSLLSSLSEERRPHGSRTDGSDVGDVGDVGVLCLGVFWADKKPDKEFSQAFLRGQLQLQLFPESLRLQPPTLSLASAMPCRCTVDNLRLFVRSIAQVDLPTSTRFAASQQFPIRSFRPATTHTNQRVLCRAYSTNASFIDHGSLGELTHTEPASAPERWPELDRGRQSPTFDADSVLIDFSPDAVDVVAAELGPQKPGQQHETRSNEYETPSKDLLKDIPLKQLKQSAVPISRTTFRRTKVANESFALHFSSPRRADPAFKAEIKSTPTSTAKRDDWTPPAREQWQIDKAALSKKFPNGWNPQKRLSPDAIDGIRALHAQMPERYTTEALSQEFGVTAEAIRRILKSKWSPSPEEETDRQRRWFKRGQQVWSRYADLGLKPPKPWRDLGIGQGKPEWMNRKQEWARRQQEPRSLPALVTTARRREARAASEAASTRSSLADRIL
jgi:hypothetical protein